MRIELPRVYGNNLKAYLCKDPEVILAGPRDTGKTIALLTKIHWLAHKYPNASIVIARKQLTDVYGTVLQTFDKFIRDPSVEVFGGEKAQWYDYPNGSRVWVAGLDKPGKTLSAEHDIIYVNQAEQLNLLDWETCTSTTTGRAGNIPYNQTIGDCNPAHPAHWIMTRSKEGGPLTRFDSTHRDNPDLYDQATGRITEEGERRIGALRRLTGARKLRLADGLWAAPEGAIYDVFDDTRHKVRAFAPDPLWQRAVGIDPAGAYRAAVWLAFDPINGVLNVYRELLVPHGSTVDSFAEKMLVASGYTRHRQPTVRAEPIQLWVCGAKAERDWRTEFLAAGIPVIPPPVTDVGVGIDRVYQLLREFKLVIHESCPNLLTEIGSYSRVMKDGLATDKIENKEAYHCLDALRYVVVALTQPPETEEVISLPWAHIR